MSLSSKIMLELRAYSLHSFQDKIQASAGIYTYFKSIANHFEFDVSVKTSAQDPFNFDADPDPGSQNLADPDPMHWSKLVLRTEPCYGRKRSDFKKLICLIKLFLEIPKRTQQSIYDLYMVVSVHFNWNYPIHFNWKYPTQCKYPIHLNLKYPLYSTGKNLLNVNLNNTFYTPFDIYFFQTCRYLPSSGFSWKQREMCIQYQVPVINYFYTSPRKRFSTKTILITVQKNILRIILKEILTRRKVLELRGNFPTIDLFISSLGLYRQYIQGYPQRIRL